MVVDLHAVNTIQRLGVRTLTAELALFCLLGIYIHMICLVHTKIVRILMVLFT